MKTNKILLVYLLLALSINLFSQNLKSKNFKNIENRKGICEIYQYGDEEIAYTVWNNKNKYENVVPKYMYDETIPSIEVENKQLLDDLVIKYFKPYFENFSNFSYRYLYIYLYSNNEGKVNEVLISYPKNIGIIAASIIEEFEKEIKTSIRLSFNKNYSSFKESEWIGKPVMYNSKDIKNM